MQLASMLILQKGANPTAQRNPIILCKASLGPSGAALIYTRVTPTNWCREEKKKQKKQPMALIEVQSWKRPESWVWEISGGGKKKNGQNFFFGGGWTMSCDVAAAARQLKANVDGKKRTDESKRSNERKKTQGRLRSSGRKYTTATAVRPKTRGRVIEGLPAGAGLSHGQDDLWICLIEF